MSALEEVHREIEANERGRLRGINHLRATLETWDEMNNEERREAVAEALDRLERPF